MAEWNRKGSLNTLLPSISTALRWKQYANHYVDNVGWYKFQT